MEANNIPVRRNRLIYSITGVVKKAGAGWVYVEQDYKPETFSETIVDENGEEQVQDFIKTPWNVLIAFAKTEEHALTINNKYTFNVTTSLELDKKTSRVNIRHWLVSTKPIAPVKKVAPKSSTVQKVIKKVEEQQPQANNPHAINLDELTLDIPEPEKKLSPGTPKRRY